MANIDDYDMIDKDIEGSMQYGRECFEAEAIMNDESKDWPDRIRAAAELEHVKLTKAEKRKEYQRRTWNKEIKEIFQSFELPLFEKLDEVDGIMAQIFKEASMFNIPASIYRPYVVEQVTDMIDQIAEQRESQRGPILKRSQYRGRGEQNAM
ncbi:hypothetical protein V3851_04450 [Paenibacillus sp. M1]|uniref:Uncharacterized protein n=1 Tax=Paenibacillus haidiansis TaxID=1574488 RepID=A0ABU7VP42_9BACL